MKGSNKLILNQATMVEAVQEWVDKRLSDKPRVACVQVEAGASRAGYSDPGGFIVELESGDPPTS